jgi:hypothetical protein
MILINVVFMIKTTTTIKGTSKQIAFISQEDGNGLEDWRLKEIKVCVSDA